MNTYPATTAKALAVLASLLFHIGDLCGQDRSDVGSASSEARTLLVKGLNNGAIGFFADGPAPNVKIGDLPDDQFFDRYLPLGELSDAWEAMNSNKLTDLAIQAAEGERVLLRGRHGLSTDSLWQIALRAAEVQGNGDALKRLETAADRSGMKEFQDRLQAAVALAGESRAADEATTINPLEVSAEDFVILKEYSRSIEGAAVRGDSRYLQDIKNNLDTLFSKAPALRKFIESLLKRPLSQPSFIPLEPKVVGRMDQLLAESRQFGGWKPPKIDIRPPRIDIPDPTKAAREAAERARRAVEAEARRAEEFARQRAETARKAKETEARRAADAIREREETARKSAEAETARRAVEAAQQAGRDIDRERLAATEQLRRYLLPIAGQYIAYLDSQASNRYHALPQGLQEILAAHYPNVDLGSVRYAESINTLHGQGITIGDNIYFPTNVDFENNYSHLHWLLHELEHVGQYRAHGGVEPFLIKYLANGGIQIGANRSFNIHDNINIERDAENKANRIAGDVWRVSRSASGGRPTFPLVGNASDPLAGTWRTDGRTASFSNGMCTIQTSNGSASFRYSYDQGSGMLVGVDGNGVRTETRINWLSQNSIEWVSPAGRRHYVRVQ